VAGLSVSIYVEIFEQVTYFSAQKRQKYFVQRKHQDKKMGFPLWEAAEVTQSSFMTYIICN